MTGPTGSTRPTDKAVHAWSLDGTLGHPRVPGPDGSGSITPGGQAVGALDLLDDALTHGAHHARVATGRSAPTPELLAASARRLSRLADGHPGIQLVTENWREMMPDADSVLALLADAGDVRLLIDLGNWTMPDKHEQLARIAPHAVTCHAKAHRHEDGRLDEVNYARALRVLQDAGYAGALAMVNESSRPDGSDEWDGLEQEHEVVRRVFG